jgi:hypothetical protein
LISFRYHLVTIVAVFLALGLGLLAGTTVIKPLLVNELQRKTSEAQNRAADAERLATDLRSSVEELIPFVVSGRLPGTDVVIVTYEGADGGMLGQVQSSLQTAGANVLAVIPITARMTLTDPGTRPELAHMVGAPPATPRVELQRDVAGALARRLTSSGRTSGPPDTDLLGELVSQGFIRKGDISPVTLREIGARPNQVVVAVTGAGTRLELTPQAFMIPLVEQLVGRTPVVAGQPTETVDPFVPLIRSDDAVPPEEIVTVDDLDVAIGGAALVLGANQLLESPSGGGGNYGVDGTSLIPAPAPFSPAP